MIFTVNEYLDARRPEFANAELLGRVVYEARTRVIRVYEPGIAAWICGERAR